MQDYGNYTSQRVNYQNPPVKKREKEEKIKKAVTYTLGTLAGVSVAALVGYGIINKNSQGKKIVDKAKDAASEVVNKGKDKINPSSQKKGREVLFKVLANIKNGNTITLQDLKTAQTTVNTMLTLNDGLTKTTLSKYSVLLKALIDKYKDEKSDFKVEDAELKNNAEALENESQNILTQAFAQADFNTYLAKNSINFKNIQLKENKKNIYLSNTSTKSDIKINLKSKLNSAEMVLLNEDKQIYVENGKEIKNDTELYILHDGKYYEITASDLRNLADVTTIQGDEIISIGDVETFDDNNKIVKCQQEGESDSAIYIYGAKNASNETKYVKISDLTSEKLALLVDTNVFNDIVTNNNVKTETWGEVLNSNKDNKFVNADGKLTNAGKALMDGIKARIENAGTDDTKKAKIILGLLTNIEDAKFADKSVGKAVVNSLLEDNNVTDTVLSQVLNENTANKLVDAEGKLTDAGTALMDGIEARIKNAGTDDTKKARIILNLLSNIEDAKFTDKSVGKAVVNSLINDKDIAPDVFADVLKNCTKGKLIKSDKTLTETGKDLLDYIIKKGLTLDDLNKVVNGKIKNYKNEDNGIQTTNDEPPKLQINRAKYYFNYLKNMKMAGKEIGSTESLVLYSLLKDEKKKEYFQNSTLDTNKLDTYTESHFNDGAEYKDYSAMQKLETAKNVLNSNDETFIKMIPGCLDDTEWSSLLADNTIQEILVDTSLADDEKLTKAGQALLKGYAAKKISKPEIYTSLTYEKPNSRTTRNSINDDISINGVRFKFYEESGELKYYVGQQKK